MLKYTPSKNIVAELQKIQNGPYVLNKEYEFCRSFFSQENNYNDSMMMMQYFCWYGAFYSEKPVKFVPVMGSMFPVEMFDIENVV